jgi:protocatechuate 3,4-dioxygenase beta subunit
MAKTSWFPVAFILMLTVRPAPSSAQRGDCGGVQPEDWRIVIAEENEPGERLTVTGTVYAADGATPAVGATVFVYHTDSSGYYSLNGKDEANARLCGLMLTNDKGQYRFDTIRPGPYPASRVPEHVHYVVWGDGIPRQRFDLNFADDPLLKNEYREGSPSWSTVRPLAKDADGLLHCEKDIRLSRP